MGGITAYNYGTISNCVNEASFYATGQYQNWVSIGGIAANNYGTIDLCENRSNIVMSSVDYVVCGGIVRHNDNHITNCVNYSEHFAYEIKFKIIQIMNLFIHLSFSFFFHLNQKIKNANFFKNERKIFSK